MSKRFCVHGHDTCVVGRASNGQCRDCEEAPHDIPKIDARAERQEAA